MLHDRRLSFERERGVTRIAVRNGLSHYTVACTPAERLDTIRALADARVPIFLIKIDPDGFSFLTRGNHAADADHILGQRQGRWHRADDLSLVSTIAGSMRDLSGVISRIHDALIEAKVGVRRTGDAYDAVHCLVDGTNAPAAVAALERAFGLETGGAA
ncbi:MAG: hypothetical protein ACKO5K_09815 [Armatimonadota bacterium]